MCSAPTHTHVRTYRSYFTTLWYWSLLPFSYKRKLKAAKAMNSAATVVIQNQKTGPVVPGTNKYTKEG